MRIIQYLHGGIIFHIFTRVENEPLKQRIKQLKKITKVSSFAKHRNIFCFIKIHNLIISCKIDPISADKLCKDEEVEIDEITELFSCSLCIIYIAEIGSILQDIIKCCILINQKVFL